MLHFKVEAKRRITSRAAARVDPGEDLFDERGTTFRDGRRRPRSNGAKGYVEITLLDCEVGQPDIRFEVEHSWVRKPLANY